MQRLVLWGFVFICFVGKAAPRTAAAYLKARPKLVVLIVLDQFRADYLTRFYDKFIPAKGLNGKPGGFKYLLENGAWFPQSHFSVLQNMTGPGHATLLTGAYPYLTGIPLNEWFDSEKGEKVYCVSDSQNVWLTNTQDKNLGTSPKNLLGTTLGDELRNIHSGSQVVSLSIKDRSAILMGGHRAQLVLWMDPQRLQWTSTKYYLPQGILPPWVNAINDSLKKNGAMPASSAKLLSPVLAQVGSFFPKSVKWGDKGVLATPAGLELTEKLAENAVAQLGLGKDGDTDLLALSFSSHDYAGHTYGPYSPHMEEMTLADDLVLSQLFTFLNRNLPNGMKDAVVVLTADHGVAPNPELAENGKLDAGRVNEEELFSKMQRKMEERFGSVEKGWLLKSAELNFYLNTKAGKEKGIEREILEEFLKEQLVKEKGIAHAFSLTDYRRRTLPPGLFQEQILNTYFPGRSGDVVVILKPYYISGDETATHQTGYSYDSHIPLVFAGSSIRAGVYASPSEPVDIAPTLSFLLGTVPPSGSHGKILREIFVEGTK